MFLCETLTCKNRVAFPSFSLFAKGGIPHRSPHRSKIPQRPRSRIHLLDKCQGTAFSRAIKRRSKFFLAPQARAQRSEALIANFLWRSWKKQRIVSSVCTRFARNTHRPIRGRQLYEHFWH
jgi:hypothetical protein